MLIPHRRSLLLLFVVALAIGVPGSQAQSPQALEALHQLLLPLFELSGVVFTDADETSNRLVVGVLDRHVEGLVRARLRVLGISPQFVDVVETEPIRRVATLRDKVGQMTGWTEGIVTRTCVNTGVSDSDIVLLCQDFVENTVQIVNGGDSVTLLGNLWGANSSDTLFVYSPIVNIERELGALTTF